MKNRLAEIYRNTRDILFEYNEKRKHYNNFFEFHQATGLGGKYKMAHKKYEICIKLIYKK